MATKRKTSNISTGGTGDVRPQILNLNMTQATVNQEQVEDFATPVPRSQFQANLAQVMEILKVDFYLFNDQNDSSTFQSCILSTATPANAATGTAGSVARMRNQIADPRVIAAVCRNRSITTSGIYSENMPLSIDLRDTAGHGVIVATDQLTAVLSNVNGTANIACVIKVLYRMINVGVMEYVGIVQSQQ